MSYLQLTQIFAEMDEKTFDAMMEQGYQQAVNGESRPIGEAFADIRKKM